MKCKNCKREIEENSIFCNWCGTRQIKEDKKEVKIPEPVQLPSGSYRIYLRAEKQSITEPTPEKCKAKARAIRSGYLEQQSSQPKITVGSMIDKYIAANEKVLSPSTIKAYKSYRDHRFQGIIDNDISNVSWQTAINKEISDGMSPKTIANAWRLITASAKFSNVSISDVKLPKKIKSERPWLDYEDIEKLLENIHGEECEIAALILLHGLRRSEAYDLTMDDIDLQNKTINVAGAMVYDQSGKLVHKDQNKNETSTRTVPIVIPRLLELLEKFPNNGQHIIDPHHKRPYEAINRVCKRAGIPEVGCHGLRHSAVSLAYHIGWSPMTTMRVFGYSNMQVVNDVYTHLAAKDKNKDIKKMERYYTKIGS